MYQNKKTFYPKRPVRSFRDLEVYAKTLECAVDVVRLFTASKPFEKFPFREHMAQCALSIPLTIAEAHSVRFGDHALAIQLLEKAMAGCNKMVVYIEELRGIYGQKVEQDPAETLIQNYMLTRGKLFRLEKTWRKWDEEKN